MKKPATMVTDNYSTISVTLEILGSKQLISTARRCRNYKEFQESLMEERVRECLARKTKRPSMATSNGVSFFAKDLDIKKLDELIARL